MLDSTPSRETGNLTPASKAGYGNPPEHSRWAPGKSGNPRGRPKKDLDLAALAQKHAEKAVMTLVDVMSNEEATPAARVSAASELLDRGFGRAPASLDVNHTMTISAEFEAFMRALVGKRQSVIEASAVEVEALPDPDQPSGELASERQRPHEAE